MQKSYKIAALLCSLCLILGLFGGYVLAASPTVTTWLQSGSLSSESQFIIWEDGGNYFSKNGETGKVITSTNASDLVQNSLDLLTANRTQKEKVSLKGSFVFDSEVTIENNTYLDLSGAYITLEANADCRVLVIEGSNVTVSGGIIDANHQNQGTPEEVFELAGGYGTAINKEVTIADNTFYNVHGFAIHQFGGATNKGQNIIYRNNIIYQLTGSDRDLLVIVADGGQVVNNKIYVKQGLGINIYESDNIQTYGNYIQVSQAVGSGIALSSSLYSPIFGNTIEATTDAVAFKIITEGDNADARLQIGGEIYGNYIKGAGGVGVAVRIENCSYVNFHDNVIEDFNQGLVFYQDDIDSMYFKNNNFFNVTNPRIDVVSPTNTYFRFNVGYVTENQGSASISASTYVDVAHGLVSTPTSIRVSIASGGYGSLFVDNVNATHFRINVASGGSYTVYWECENYS